MDDALHLGDTVEVITDNLNAQRAPRGSVGIIVDDWTDGSNDVQITDKQTGEDVALVRAAPGDIQLRAPLEPAPKPEKPGMFFGRGDHLGAPVGGAPSLPGEPFSGIGGPSARPWFGAEPPPEGDLGPDIPWELRDEPPTGPVFN